jgi:hypothetical protein
MGSHARRPMSLKLNDIEICVDFLLVFKGCVSQVGGSTGRRREKTAQGKIPTEEEPQRFFVFIWTDVW